MIVAIINQTVPAGVVKVEEFVEAPDAATAVADYVNGYTPPRNPADYLGFDTGWAQYTPPPSGSGYYWGYDFGTPGLVEVLLPETQRLLALSLALVVSDPKADPSGGSTPFAWEDMGLLSIDSDFWFQDMDKAQFRVWGQHKTSQNGANVPQVRLAAGGAAMSDEIELPDTAGAWVNFGFSTISYTIPGGRTLFKVQTKLRNALSTIELQAVSIAMLKKL